MKTILSFKEKIAALFFILSALIFIGYLVGIVIERKMFVKTIDFFTIIENGEGLRRGGEITLSGVKIGEIEAIDIREDNSLKLHLIVYHQYGNKITDQSILLVERLYGIGEKKLKIIPKKRGTPLPPNAMLPSVEKMDILDLIYELNLDDLVETLDKTTSIMGKFIEQLESENRIERFGLVLDNISKLLSNLNRLVSESQEPLIQLLNDPHLRLAVKSIHELLSNKEIPILLREIRLLLENNKIRKDFHALEEWVAQGDLKGAVKGANQLLNDPALGVLLSKTHQLLTDDSLEIFIHNFAKLLITLNEILPNTPEKKAAFIATLQEIATLIGKVQETWIFEPKTKEAFQELTIVLKAMQKTWLLDDASQAVIEEMAPLEKGSPQNQRER